MDFIFGLFSTVFIALVIGTALFFGFVLLMWVIVAAVFLSICLYLYQLWKRWQFVHSPPPPGVIEVEFHQIDDHDELR